MRHSHKNTINKPNIITAIFPEQPAYDRQARDKQYTCYRQKRGILDSIQNPLPCFIFGEVIADSVRLLKRSERSRNHQIASKKYPVGCTSKNVVLPGYSVRFQDHPYIAGFEGLVNQTAGLTVRMNRGLSRHVSVCELNKLSQRGLAFILEPLCGT